MCATYLLFYFLDFVFYWVSTPVAGYSINANRYKNTYILYNGRALPSICDSEFRDLSIGQSINNQFIWGRYALGI